jgi:hypothetical protein
MDLSKVDHKLGNVTYDDRQPLVRYTCYTRYDPISLKSCNVDVFCLLFGLHVRHQCVHRVENTPECRPKIEKVMLLLYVIYHNGVSGLGMNS